MTVGELTSRLSLYPNSCEVIRSLGDDNGIDMIMPVTMSKDGTGVPKILLMSGNEPVLEGNQIITAKESSRRWNKNIESACEMIGFEKRYKTTHTP